MSGLPGTGKTALAKELAKRLKAAYVRADTIEQALLESGEISKRDMKACGYYAGYALARENLSLGVSVVADSVNPLNITRDAWKAAADGSNVVVVEIECVCSDAEEHKRRVESRVSDIPHLVLPTWQQVLDRFYEPWPRDRLVIDTAKLSVEEAADFVQPFPLQA